MRIGQIATLLSLFFCDSSWAAVFDSQGNQVPDLQAGNGQVDWTAVVPGEGFNGVGVLGIDPFGDVCTASLLDTGPDSAPAYVLTNAHCNYFEDFDANPLGVNEYRVNQPTSYYINFNHFVSVPASQRVRYDMQTLAYITEAGTDVAIYQLNATLGDLRSHGFSPLDVTDRDPPVGETVTLVGVPLLYVPTSWMSLQKSDCQVGDQASLLNGTYLAPHSVIHKCSSLPGFSGGPLVDSNFEIVLLNSHGTDETIPDIADCTYESRPCELLPDGGEIVHPERNYAQETAGFANCFDVNGVFDLTQPGCSLPGATNPDAGSVVDLDAGQPEPDAGSIVTVPDAGEPIVDAGVSNVDAGVANNTDAGATSTSTSTSGSAGSTGSTSTSSNPGAHTSTGCSCRVASTSGDASSNLVLLGLGIVFVSGLRRSNRNRAR